LNVPAALRTSNGMSEYAVVYSNLQGPLNLNPITKGGFNTEDAAINFARSLPPHKTQLIWLLRDGKPILKGAAFQARVRLAGPEDRGR
jgi:hypothetical protein